MKKGIFLLVFACLLGAGALNSVNAKVAADCNAAQIAAYDGAMGAGLSESQAIDIADGVYKACAGIE